MADAPERLRFIVEPRLLDHFGIGMYNTVEKALAELVANAYDADATRVEVTVDARKIVVKDDGRGMTTAEVQDHYLRIGRDRRADEHREKTVEYRRPIIGNKGIGKLAGLGIARSMVVVTQKGLERTTLRIERDELDARRSLDEVDLRTEITRARRRRSGTEIRLEEFLDGLADVNEEDLREHLATELPSAPNFTILVNGVEATPEDIPGDRFPISDEIPGYGRVRGYYKIVTKRSMSVAPGLAVRIRDRIVQPRTLFGLNQQTHGFFVVTKIIGELEPDFIDPIRDRTPADAFAINTSRTGLNPESPKVQALNQYAREKLRTIADGEAQKRKARRKAAAFDRHPELEARMQRLAPEVYRKLDRAIDRIIETLARNEKREVVDDIIDIVIRYYESDALRTLVDSIKGQDDADISRLAELLAQFGSRRITDLAELLWSQLAVIQSLQSKVEAGALEREIHKIVAANVWLVRESLQYWYDNRTFATQLGNALAREFRWDRRKRADLVCFDDHKVAGEDGRPNRLVVIEFKRPGVTVDDEEYLQVMKYKAIFEGSLTQFGRSDIEIWVFGDAFSRTIDREALRSSGYHLLSYVELLEAARGRYRDLYDRLMPDGEAPPHPGVVMAAEDDLDADDEELEGEMVEPGVRL